jgi:hypothetical protein
MDGVILMGESLCRADPDVSLHLTVPEASAPVRAWAQGKSEITLTTTWPDGVSGWDSKPWLLLQELEAGRPEVLWLDDDVIVTSPITRMLDEFPRDSLVVSDDWTSLSVPVSHFWGMHSVRPVPLFNACFVRATQAHRPLLERWLQMIRDPRYREAQKLPFERRPLHLSGEGWLLIALLESEEFGQIPFDRIRRGRHIAQCAGSSAYRPHDRLLDLFRGLPPLIHGLGRKPWQPMDERGRLQEYLLDLATDVSPYVLAARRVARSLDMNPKWIQPRTSLGAILRALTAGHPGMAGLPLAIPHAVHMRLTRQSS